MVSTSNTLKFAAEIVFSSWSGIQFRQRKSKSEANSNWNFLELSLCMRFNGKIPHSPVQWHAETHREPWATCHESWHDFSELYFFFDWRHVTPSLLYFDAWLMVCERSIKCTHTHTDNVWKASKWLVAMRINKLNICFFHCIRLTAAPPYKTSFHVLGMWRIFSRWRFY